MRFVVSFLAVLVPAVALAQPLETSDYYPNKAFLARAVRLRADTPPANVQQVGEVVILEGDDDLVTSDGMGGFGIDSTTNQPTAISARFYDYYPDEFDELIVFTTFDDQAAMGAAAYEISAIQDVDGIGRPKFDSSSVWGADSHRLHAFVNMMRWDNYEGLGQGIIDPANYMYKVLGQEFAHRWLSFFHYVDSTGAVSSAMLGRDASHWASTLQADASVMDGNLFGGETTDGYYPIVDYFEKYSQLDQYGMGLIDAIDVEPFFLLHNAVTSTGKAVDPTKQVRTNSKLKGAREDITIESILAAEGPRNPTPAQSPHDFRVAWVLLTRPGEAPESVSAAALKLDQARRVWEDRFHVMTDGHGTMCTQVSAPCGAATARVDGGNVHELGGNGNDIVEPGESVFVDFQILNDSTVPAKSIVVSAKSDFVTADPTTIDELDPLQLGQAGFFGAIPGDAQCGVPLTINAEAVLDGHTFRGFTQVTPGLTTLLSESFESGPGMFQADDKTTNGWEYGTPQAYASQYGYTYQPNGGHNSDKAWFTGLTAGHRAMNDSSLAVGTSQLSSAPIDVSKTYMPAVHYWAWYQAIDFSNPAQGGQINGTLAMVLEGSADGGQSWVELDRVTGANTVWQERLAPLDGKLPLKDKIVLRWTVSNDSTVNQVEAGLDDVELRTLTQACNPDAVNVPLPPTTTPQHGGCELGAPGRMPPVSGLVLLALVLLALAHRRRA
jgi:hypothetical protein